MKSLPLALLAAVALSTSAHAVTIWSNTITGTNPNTDNPYTTGQTVAANITVSGIGRGTGIAGANANDRYNASGWNSVALDTTDYFTFTLTPDSGFQIDFTSVTYTGQASGTGPTMFAFRSSLDGFTSNIGSPSATGTMISLTGSEFQSVTGAIEFRFYAWNASSAAGTFSINDFTFDGRISAVTGNVPESSPGLVAFACVFAALVLARQLMIAPPALQVVRR